MTSRKRCPVCGLVQPEALDCSNCATSLINVPPFSESQADNIISGQSRLSGLDPPEGIEKKPVDVKPASSEGRQIVFQGKKGRLLKVKSGDILGRASVGSDFFADYPKVSRRHARIVFEDGQWIIEDLGSANGLFIDGHRIDRAPLELGGDFALSLSCELTVVSC